MTDVRFCKVQFEKPPLAPERRPREGSYSPPGAALGAGRSENPPRRGRLEPSWRDLGPSGEGRQGPVEDSVGQQATLTSCQPGSDTPGPPVGLWAGDRPPSAQIRTIIPPQVHRPGQWRPGRPSPTGASGRTSDGGRRPWPTSAGRSGWAPNAEPSGLRGESRSRQATRC